jgi:8-oxo-dGTP pyrophosphatase MutT (NUDIX family)
VPSFYRDPEAPAPNNPPRVGVVAFIVRDGALLLERRADFGTWGIPGGALEEDEMVDEVRRFEIGPAHAPLIDAYLSSDVRPIIALSTSAARRPCLAGRPLLSLSPRRSTARGVKASGLGA